MSTKFSRPIWMQKYNLLFTILITGLFIYTGIKGIENGPSGLEHNFPFRKEMISFFTEFRLKINDRVFQQGLVGKDGWLEFTTEGNLDDYQNTVPLSPGRLEKLQASLHNFYSELSAREITLLIIIAPNKATIYPEKLPAEIQKAQPISQMDTLLSFISENGHQVFIDVRPMLLEAKKDHQLYYQTDTHWNTIGAFYAYKSIIDTLSENYPELQANELSDFTQSTGNPSLLDISKVMGATTLLESPPILTPNFVTNTQWITINSDIVPASLAIQSDKNLPKAIIYQDSFGEGLKPYLSLHFSSSLFLHKNSRQKDMFSYTFVDQFNPDIIIIEIAERDLLSLLFLLDRFR